MRQQFPENAQDRLCDTTGPHRAVKIAALVALASGGGLDSRQQTAGAEYPNRSGDWEIAVAVDLLQAPSPGANRHRQAGQIEYRESNDDTPGEGVADPAIEWVGFVFHKADDVGLRLDSR